MHTDVLIIGSGIAGLAFAIKLAERKPNLHITLTTKADRFESNTKYAQGGIAAVMDNIRGSFESHIMDTLQAGKGFSNVKTVKLVVEKAPDRLRELIDWGTPFDKTSEGNWDYGREGGHSTARILHHKDQTGLAMEKALLKQLGKYSNIHFQTEWFATELAVQNNQCYGARFLNPQGKPILIRAKVTYLATGGSGQVFSKTTNPVIATGDGVAMASRAGATLQAMAFYQFHPTALAVKAQNPLFLITEALRGFGAHLINKKGERFLFRHHPDGELATRDVISRAIFREMQENHLHHLWLDCRHLDPKALKARFPTIVKECKRQGIDLFNELIPVAPAAHYQCGGIKVNHQGKTTIHGLYANGECASTGLHGANRLASNSLLEAVVFAHEAAVSVCATWNEMEQPVSLAESIEVISGRDEAPFSTVHELKNKLQKLMYAFYLNNTLEQPLTSLVMEMERVFLEVHDVCNRYQLTQALWEVKNMAETGRLILQDTLYE